MEFYKFDKDNGINVSKFNSNFIMSRIIQTDQKTNIGCMHLERNGIVGYHQAVVPQLLLIVNGEGYVRNETSDYYRVVSGDAVFWGKDEWHETKSREGLTAIVIESKKLEPALFMQLENRLVKD